MDTIISWLRGIYVFFMQLVSYIVDFYNFFASVWDYFVEYLDGVCTVFLDFLQQAFDALLALPWTIIEFLSDCFLWLRESIFNSVVNFIIDQLLKMADTFFPSWQLDENQLHIVASKINQIFPLDDLLTVAVFLLNTWIAVKLFKLFGILSIRYMKPPKMFGK